jgi:hypothetical protein
MSSVFEPVDAKQVDARGGMAAARAPRQLGHQVVRMAMGMALRKISTPHHLSSGWMTK